jgi:putative serine protease PepD
MTPRAHTRIRSSLVAVVAAATVGAAVAAGTITLVDNGGTTATLATTTSSPIISAEAALAESTLTPSEIFDRAAPGVVDITVAATSGEFGPFGAQEQQAEGSGFVVDKKGNIVTNYHVVSGVSSITVTFQDGTTAKATLVGSDASTDLAVIHVSVAASRLHPLTLGNSTTVDEGDPVVAIGSPFGLPESITAGIVSAVDREIEAPNGAAILNAIQTDAAINSGNSGGPLLNSSGEVIGVNAQINSASGGNDGVGFAIPSNTVKSVVSQIVAGKTVQHAYLGVTIQTVTAAAATQLGTVAGVQVTEVSPGSPAASAGLRAGTETVTVDGITYAKDGDVIVAIDGVTVATSGQLRAEIDSHVPGDKVTLTVVRDGVTRTITVALGNRPAS